MSVLDAPELALPDPRSDAPAVEVPIAEALERWSELRLEDGTVLRVRIAAVAVHRTDQFDSDGNPVYQVKWQPIMAVASVAPRLRQRRQ